MHGAGRTGAGPLERPEGEGVDGSARIPGDRVPIVADAGRRGDGEEDPGLQDAQPAVRRLQDRRVRRSRAFALREVAVRVRRVQPQRRAAQALPQLPQGRRGGRHAAGRGGGAHVEGHLVHLGVPRLCVADPGVRRGDQADPGVGRAPDRQHRAQEGDSGAPDVAIALVLVRHFLSRPQGRGETVGGVLLEREEFVHHIARLPAPVPVRRRVPHLAKAAQAPRQGHGVDHPPRDGQL
mmetsp:Transcript_51684/g.157035  ORF Transcript_51684/g.157035 Transcript_51684/m.157035 type:complete len:237 (-) Transcript_51684:613-1323(-)